MSNILISLRKITLALVVLLLTTLVIIASSMYNIYSYLIYGGIIILFIFLIKELLSKKGLYSDILFNGANVASMIYILIVILRSMLDKYIIISNTEVNANGIMTFFNNNFIFMFIIVSCLIMYNILMMIGDEKK